ncbi:MAG: ornithine carbamoyltransferase [Magnetococcales bacterium]|nr:ornithine carbamoyltransferase [Magnetococcales bacterium]
MERAKRDLLTLSDITPEEMQRLFARAAVLKRARQAGASPHSLRGRTLGMIFEKASTRTRVSFEAGMFQLGGHAIFLSSRDTQLGRGETIADSARVLSRYVDGLMIRTFDHGNVETMARHATVPVINGLSDAFHPCQVLADLLTFQERRGSLVGRRVAWIGDGNNMANTWIQAAVLARFHLVLACPAGYDPDPAVLALATTALQGVADASVTLQRAPEVAATDADLIVTDTWISMGQEEEHHRRLRAFAGYQVDDRLMRLARAEALFMHCLPAHRGEEVTDAVLDGSQSVVWDEAENRLHVQKAILEWLLLPGGGWFDRSID